MMQTNPVPSEASLDALVKDLEMLEAELNNSIEYHKQIYGNYVHDGQSPAIVEHQLNKRDLGEEPRILAKAAAAITALRERERRLRDIDLAETLAHCAWDAVERQGAKGPCVCDMNYAQAAEEIQAEIIAILDGPQAEAEKK